MYSNGWPDYGESPSGVARTRTGGTTEGDGIWGGLDKADASCDFVLVPKEHAVRTRVLSKVRHRLSQMATSLRDFGLGCKRAGAVVQ